MEELPQAGAKEDGRSPALSQEQWQRLGDVLKELGMNEETAAQVKNGQLLTKDVLQLVRQLCRRRLAGTCRSRLCRDCLAEKNFRRY